MMKTIFLDKNKQEYPYVYLPDIVIQHIKEKYSDSEKIDFLQLKKPTKNNFLREDSYFSYIFGKEKIDINSLLNLKYDSINKDLENHTHYIGNYKLPKKPILHNIKEIEYTDYETGFSNIFKSLILIPIIGFLLYLVIAVFGPIFISFEERREIPLLKYLTIISITIYSILLIYGITVKGLFEKKIRIERELLNEKTREKLLDDYKLKVQSIIDEHNLDYQNELKKFNCEFQEKSHFAEIGILNNKISQSNNIGLIDNKNTQKGRSEIIFLKYLYDEFGRSILIDYSPNIGKNPFQPDFILFDKETNLYFDIEIDEPYSLINGETIHHNRTTDEERNSFFNKINWAVIRFTEKQIIESPIECVALLKKTLEAIKIKSEFITHNIEIENFWTHEEALIMKMNNFRNSYK